MIQASIPRLPVPYSSFYLLLIAIFTLSWSACSDNPQKTDASVVADQPLHPRSSQDPASPKGKLLPFDGASENKNFLSFRTELVEILKSKDVQRLQSVLDTHVVVSLGGEYGIQSFLDNWGLDNNADSSTFWNESLRVLNMGGSFIDQKLTIFEAPYVSSLFPHDYDFYTYFAITGEGVRVRKTPGLNGKLLGSLDYDLVEGGLAPHGEFPHVDTIDGESYAWEKIRMPKGEVGYVYGKYIRSPLDYRLIIEEIGGEWKIMSFVAGD